jgi:hypothetical protein
MYQQLMFFVIIGHEVRSINHTKSEKDNDKD